MVASTFPIRCLSGYYTQMVSALRPSEEVLGSIPPLPTRGKVVVVVVLRVRPLRPEAAYIVPRGSVLHAGARAFCLFRWQIVTAECHIVEVRELGAASAPRLAFWARVRPNSLTVSETISRRERCLSNKKFETIQEARQKREKKINKLLALKNYTLIYIVVFDNNVLFKQDNRLIVICDINN